MINSPASKSQQTSLCPINFSNCLPTTSDHNINNYTAVPFEKVNQHLIFRSNIYL